MKKRASEERFDKKFKIIVSWMEELKQNLPTD